VCGLVFQWNAPHNFFPSDVEVSSGLKGDHHPLVKLQAGDYVAVDVKSASAATLFSSAVARTTIDEFYAVYGASSTSAGAGIL
jgi:hypothetical protein